MGLLAGPLAALWLATDAALVWWPARRIAKRLDDGAGSPLTGAVITTVVAGAILVLSLELLGSVGALHPAGLLAVHLAVAAVARRVPAGTSTATHLPSPNAANVVLGVVLTAAAALLVGLALNGPSHDTDTMRYHIVNAGQWLSGHSMWSLPFAETGDSSSTNPANGELLGLWFMLALHTDQLAYLANVVSVGFALLVVVWLAELLGARDRRISTTAALALLFCPIVYIFNTHALTTDVFGGSMVVTAVGMGLHATSAHRPPRGTVAVAGLALGLGLGSKYVLLLPALAVGAALVWRSGEARLGTLVALSAGGFSTGGYWYLRNWAEVGNPIYPATIRLAGAQLFTGSDVYGDTVSLAGQLAGGHVTAALTWFGLALIVLGPLLLVLVVVPALAWRAGGRPRFTAALVALAFIIYTAAPLTGGGGTPIKLIVMTATMRYSIVALLTATALTAVHAHRKPVQITLAAALGYDIALMALHPSRADLTLSGSAPLLLAVALAGGLAALTAWIICGRRDRLLVGAGTRIGTAGLATGVLIILIATSPAPTTPAPVAEAARLAGPRGVIVVNVFDVRALMGARLDLPIRSVGRCRGESPCVYPDPAEYSRQIAPAAPTVVAVGHGVNPPPVPWAPGPRWRSIGTVADFTLYAVPCDARGCTFGP